MFLVNVKAVFPTINQILAMYTTCGRDQDYASTSYDSPRFARRISGASFVPRRSDPRGYSPSYSQQRYADQDDDTSSFESKPGNSMAADDDSYDEGELPSVHRFAFATKPFVCMQMLSK